LLIETDSDRGNAALWRSFHRAFEVSLADTEAERQAIYRFRYHIFCEKLGFIDPRPFRDRQEKDDFDKHSLHCYVTHRASGKIAGCVRLVTVDASNDLPLERYCRGGLHAATLRHLRSRRGHVAEISRLAVACPFSMHVHRDGRDSLTNEIAELSHAEQQSFPHVAFCLMAAAASCADVLRRNECYALMERTLRVRLKRIGIATMRMGDDVEYEGTVAPYLLEIDDAVRSLPLDYRLFYDRVRELVGDTLCPVHARPLRERDQEGSNEALGSGLMHAWRWR
jgi:N-acyl amino acid synthase of PEP-CTERM/exosortase system